MESADLLAKQPNELLAVFLPLTVFFHDRLAELDQLGTEGALKATLCLFSLLFLLGKV